MRIFETQHYDPRSGGERGGVGVFDDGSANICLDYAKDKEAVCMSVAAGDAYVDVSLMGTPKEKAFDRVSMYLGDDGVGAVKVMSADCVNGFILKAGLGAPQISVFDGGEPVGEVPWKRESPRR